MAETESGSKMKVRRGGEREWKADGGGRNWRRRKVAAGSGGLEDGRRWPRWGR